MAKQKPEAAAPAPAPKKGPVNNGRVRTRTVHVVPQPEGEPKAPDIFDIGDVPDHSLVQQPAAVPPAEVPAAPAAPEKPTHPAYLVEMATGYGFTADDLAGLTTAELEKAVQATHRREMQRQAAVQEAAARPAAPAAPAAPPATQAQPGDDGIDWGVDETGKPYTADDFSPGIVRQIRAQHAKLKSLEQKFGSVEQQSQADQAAKFRAQLEAAFARHPDVFGKGDTEGLPQGSMELSRRVAAYNHIVSLASAKRHTTVAQDIDGFRVSMFGAAVQKAEATPAAPPAAQPAGRPTPEQWQQGALARPTSRDGSPEPKGEERAKKYVAKKLAEMGVEAQAQTEGADFVP